MRFTRRMSMDGMRFSFNFVDDLCLLGGYSGTGKTYAAKIVKSKCDKDGITAFYIDGEESEDDIVSVINGNKDNEESILILDHADVCYSERVVDALNKYKGMLIIIFNNQHLYEKIAHVKMGHYYIRKEDGVFKVKRSSRGPYVWWGIGKS